MTPVVILILFILMELEFLLNDSLYVLLSETFYQIEFIFENHNAEKYFSVFEFAFSKLKFSYFSYFFHYWLNLTLKILIKSHQLDSAINWIRAANLLWFFIIIFLVDHIINLSYFFSNSNFWSISFIIYDDFFS